MDGGDLRATVEALEQENRFLRKVAERKSAEGADRLRASIRLLTTIHKHEDQTKELVLYRGRALTAERKLHLLQDAHQFWVRLWASLAVAGWVLFVAEALRHG